MLTAKENFMQCLRGEVPEWVPIFTMGAPIEGIPVADALVEPLLVSEHRARGGGRDIWGVNWVATESTGNAVMPDTSEYILKDIRKWRDVVKAPDLSGIDWEAMCRKDFEDRGIDPSKTAVAVGPGSGYFQQLMAFMGFEEGLCAFYDEPDEVKALFAYLSDFYYEVASKYVEHCKPDVWSILDDTAAWQNPFISLDMYREFLLPLYDRDASIGRERGLPITFHNCGKCEIFLDDLVGIGVTAWNPAQTCNDLAAIKRKYGNRLVITGGWDGRGRLLDDDVTYEEIYESVKKSMDLLAPGGGYCFMGSFLGYPGDEAIARKRTMLYKAVDELSRQYY
jgi:hypothetical protein